MYLTSLTKAGEHFLSSTRKVFPLLCNEGKEEGGKKSKTWKEETEMQPESGGRVMINHKSTEVEDGR